MIRTEKFKKTLVLQVGQEERTSGRVYGAGQGNSVKIIVTAHHDGTLVKVHD
jgi:hypothetical protein